MRVLIVVCSYVSIPLHQVMYLFPERTTQQ
jgi:hypothetical protein